MILAPDRSLIGYGVLGMHSYQAQSGFLEVGNSNEVKLQHSNEKKSVPNYRTGVGNNNSKSRITEITGSFTLYDWTPASLAVALNAKPRGVVAGTVPDEPHPSTGVHGEHIVFNDLPDPTQPMTVKTAGGDPLAPGVDYLATPYGIQVIGTGSIDETGIVASYTKIKATALEVLAGTSGYHALHFAGMNDVQDGAVYDLTIWRAKFDVVSELPVSGTDYQPLAVSFEALADFTRVAADISQFYTFRQVDLAA